MNSVAAPMQAGAASEETSLHFYVDSIDAKNMQSWLVSSLARSVRRVKP